ncbi:MAG: STAS domain-containing protein [Phycisphaerales bacterium]|nr:STAS domain-containing protein [Phycisphaerales bacterium]
MRIEESQHGAVTVIRPLGPLASQGDATLLDEHARKAVKQSHGRVVLDASKVSFIDSFGLEALVDISDRLASSGKSFRICGISETLREVFAITELTAKFQQYEDVQGAVRSFL